MQTSCGLLVHLIIYHLLQKYLAWVSTKPLRNVLQNICKTPLKLCTAVFHRDFIADVGWKRRVWKPGLSICKIINIQPIKTHWISTGFLKHSLKTIMHWMDRRIDVGPSWVNFFRVALSQSIRVLMSNASSTVEFIIFFFNSWFDYFSKNPVQLFSCKSWRKGNWFLILSPRT